MMFILLITLISFAVCSSLVPFVIIFARKYSLVDNPKTRIHPAHTHKGIIPRAGGLAIFAGIFIPLVILVPVNRTFTGILTGALILIFIGIWDDKKDRSPYIRFITNCLAAFIAVYAGINIPYVTNPAGGIINLENIRFALSIFGFNLLISLSDILAFLWILWATNIIGWSGGVDGQLPGFVAISSFVIGILSLRFASLDSLQLQVVYLSFAAAGSFLGFLPWNFYPQKIMPGYGGKTLAGYMLSVLSILSFSKLGTALLVLAVPITDALFILAKRIISGKSPVLASSGHLHHHLLSIGWGRRRIALFYWIISAVTGFIALTLNSKQKIFAAVLILVIISGFILWINFLKKLPGNNRDEIV